MASADSPVPETAIRLVEAFAGFGPLYMRWVQSRLEQSGVSYARLRLLAMLHCKGPLIMSALGGLLGVTPRNVTTLVDGLEESGLVVRKPSPDDRRATIIELTEQGKKLGCLTSRSHQQAVAELFAELPVQDQEELLRLLGALREILVRRDVGPCGERGEGKA
jgi:DNA-binding MarR family transcriptional regulator